MSIHASQEISEYVYYREIDWVQIIEDIKDHGCVYFDICRQLGVGWSTLQGWRKGSEPRFSTGSGLLMMHAKICGTRLTKQRVDEAE
jgi:hypothetical protein